MSWDIYGNPLARGHCEVHPHIAEEYPCFVCIAEKENMLLTANAKADINTEHFLALRDERDALQAECEKLVEALTELCDEIDKYDIHTVISKTSISWFKRKARSALEAYRKGGGQRE